MIPALALAAVYLIWSPPSADLAAQTFRTHLFEANGFEVWSNAWYGGIHLPGYSLLFPPFASVLGIRVVGALSAVASAALFGMLVRPRYGDRARFATFLFGLASATNLFTGRLTFGLGLALGLAALVCVDRGKPIRAGFLAALTSAASPVAGLFLAFAGAVALIRGRRPAGFALAAPAVALIAALALLFPTGGVEPFAANTLELIGVATVVLVFIVPRHEREIRLGAVLYVALCLALFALDTPIGGNVTRLGALMAAPLLALGAWDRRPRSLVLAALVPLLYWMWVAPVRDLADAVGEPSVEAAYYEPLLAELDDVAPDRPFRVEVPPTRDRWEADYVAERYPLARGWLRQAESDDFGLFQDGNLTPASYRAWLDERAASFVAVSIGAEPDYLSADEIDLIHAGLPYLRQVWSNGDWELYEVANPKLLADAPAEVSELTGDGFAFDAPAAGTYHVRVRYSRWYEVDEGSGEVRRDGDWTAVTLDAPGTIRVAADFP